MNGQRFRRIYFIAVTLLGVIINGFYGVELLREFYSPRPGPAFREVLISAIALELGWAALLIWVIFKPSERRHVLLFTAASMLIGNLLHGLDQYLYLGEGAGAMAGNLVFGLLFAGLFVTAFWAGKSLGPNKRQPASIESPTWTEDRRNDG